MLKRRYNQSALLARALARETQADCCLDLLQRHRHTRSLDGLSRAERQRAVDGAIRINPKRVTLLEGRPVLLVDDVMTTGATLAACTRACLTEGSGPVCVATLARVAKEA